MFRINLFFELLLESNTYNIIKACSWMKISLKKFFFVQELIANFGESHKFHSAADIIQEVYNQNVDCLEPKHMLAY